VVRTTECVELPIVSSTPAQMPASSRSHYGDQ
jgi:hypothetical protein